MGSPPSCEGFLPGTLNILIAGMGERGIYLKTATNLFFAKKRVTLWPWSGYIHLNPIRAKVVKTLRDLDRYAWSGHRMILGKGEEQWMVVTIFGVALGRAAKRRLRSIVGLWRKG